MIDQDTVRRIIDAAEIVDVVKDFVNLRKAGTAFTGLCPFHNEKSPSFSVNPVKGIFKCFGCGKAGNAVTFVMEHEKHSYPEALRYLAGKYKIEIAETKISDEDRLKKTEYESLLIVSQFAQKVFSEYMLNTDEGKSIGLSYFRERGFRDDIIARFQLGFSPNQRDGFSKKALAAGYKAEYLVKTGLSIQKDSNIFDRFSGRVMFPIHSLSGKVIGFGGRILSLPQPKGQKSSDSKELQGIKLAKYLNSPESEIYHKSDILYGLFYAKKTISQLDKCYLVEGYTDVISMHQSGIENVVSSSGTSLTVNQIRLIKRFTNNVTMLYDGDAAGIKASIRGIDLVLEEGLNVKVLLLPMGEDPDSFAKKNAAEQLLTYIQENETDFIKFKTTLLLKDAQNDPVKKAGLITDIVNSIALIPDEIMRSVYAKECSKLMDTDQGVLFAEISKLRKQKQLKDSTKNHPTNQTQPDNYNQQYNAAPPDDLFLDDSESPTKVANTLVKTLSEPQERFLMWLLFNYGHVEFSNPHNKAKERVFDFVLREIDMDFSNPLYQKILVEIREKFNLEEFSIARQFVNHSDPQIMTVTADFLSTPYQLSKIWMRNDNMIDTKEVNLEKSVPLAVNEFKERILQMYIDAKNKEMQTLQTEKVPFEQLFEVMKDIKKLKEYHVLICRMLGKRSIY